MLPVLLLTLSLLTLTASGNLERNPRVAFLSNYGPTRSCKPLLSSGTALAGRGRGHIECAAASTTAEGRQGGGKGFGAGIKRKGSAATATTSRGPPNSFSSAGKAARHRAKLGGVMEVGLLDMSAKLLRKYESIQERYSTHKPVTGMTRQRGAKKSAAYHALSSYSVHFLELLEDELLYEEAEVMQRLRHWTKGRLQQEGLSVFGVVARPRGRLYKEHIIRFTLPAKKNGKGPNPKPYDTGSSKKKGSSPSSGPPPRVPHLPYHRLGPGDIIAITPDRSNPLNNPEVMEGLVLERGPWFIDVVVKELPAGMAWKRNDPNAGERFRLDLYLNRISFQRMVAAVHQMTGQETGYQVSPAIREILVRSFVESFHVVFPSSGGHQRGNGKAAGVPAPQRGIPRSPYTREFISPQSNSQTNRKGKAAANRAARDQENGRSNGRQQAPPPSLSSSTAIAPRNNWESLASQGVSGRWYAKNEADRAIKTEVSTFKLNPSQEKALRMALSRKLSLIQGPPGTGKTRTACHLINIAVRLNQRKDVGKVLAVACSNVAADNLLEGCLRLGLNAVRVGRAATVRPELRNFTLDAMLATHESVSTFKTKLEAARGLSPKETQAARRDLEDAELVAAISILGNADVVVSTCVGAANEVIVNAASVTQGSSGPIRPLKFPTVIIDEASQASEPATLVPITQGCEQLVLVGDHYQLPPTIKSYRAAQQGLGVSMFTRLALAGIQPSMLTMQYRMHPIIAQFPSRRFYGNLLKSYPTSKDRPRPAGFPWPNPHVPVAFVSVGEEGQGYFEQRTSGNQTSYMNRVEAEVVMDTLACFLTQGKLSPGDIGIVTPYSAQVKHMTEIGQGLLSRAAQSSSSSGSTGRHAKGGKGSSSSYQQELEIQSVDAFQGREKELILMSAVRSNAMGKVGFLGDWRRLNVAITRAKRGIIVFGDPRTLQHDKNWAAYLKWCSDNKCITSASLVRKAMGRGRYIPVEDQHQQQH